MNDSKIKYGSVCSGIEAASVAWHGLGWEPQWFSEIEKFPAEVLRHHYPNTPNYGDMTKFKEWKNAKSIDLLVGGTPCQSFSVAGLRKGLDDPRGNLMLTYLAMADRFKPKWIVWENVPGVLSSNRGRDFGTFLGALGKVGYGFAYRVLDAQYFGVPQRRRRVFLVGCLGDWRSAAKVLFESESMSGNPPPSREKGQRVADCLTVGANQYSGFNGEPVEAVGYAASSFGGYRDGVGTVRAAGDGFETLAVQSKSGWPADTTATLNASFGDKMGLEDQHINGGASMFVPADTVGSLCARTGRSNSDQQAVSGHLIADENKSEVRDVMGTITARMFRSLGARDVEEGAIIPQTSAVRRPNPIAFGAQNSSSQGDGVSTHVTPTLDTSKTPAVLWSIMPQNSGKDYKARAVDVTQPLMAGGPVGGNQGGDVIQQSMAVRRLTPIECERLQGFPDNYTRIAYGKKTEEDCPVGPRYKALGNSMAVPCMEWIGKRIQMVEDE